ncbi:MAG TPA: PQQ-binding-like beta-propeller repeat protein [Burkholderiales bacterium]|nr:PQQ-binding-like beta-propeller repeat protein [Burkholderiales bacterium]
MTSRGRRFALIGLVLLLFLGGAAAAALVLSDGVAWRARVLRAKVLGELPELPLPDLLRWMAPGSPVYLGALAEVPNVRSGIKNLIPLSEPTEKGTRLFGAHCASCHGDNARGRTGPDLVSLVRNNPDWAFFSAVKWGRPGTSMSPQPLTEMEIWETHSFLRHLSLRAARADLSPEASASRDVEVAAGSILAAGKRPNEWLTFAGNYAGHRHSPLSRISKTNARDLRVAWVAQLRSEDAYLEASPIVASNLMFVSESPDGVVALDAATGKKRWEFRRPLPSGLPLCCGSINRGVAILDDAVFVATLDAHVVAIKASNGRKRWETRVADFRDGYSMTGAPLALRDRVIVGVAGGEFGIRGFVAAYRASDGERLWKFDTVPGPGTPGHDTWENDSWKTGGAPTWTTGAYDPDLNLVYWGVGNPSPPFKRKDRAGANLYSNSVVALDADTGQLRWHYQFTPADEHDWDSVQQPVLAEIPWQGRPRSVLLWANRNAFFYALDRKTGEFLFAKPFAKQTWNSGFTADGRPIALPSASPTHEGTLAWPTVGGATNWWPPSYDPGRQLMYVPSIDAASIYFAADARVAKGTEQFLGSTSVYAANQPAEASIKAIEAQTGKVRWTSPLQRGPDTLRSVGGVLSTAGGVVVAGHAEEFFALDSDTGRILWRMRVGGRINAPPVAYAIGRTQFIAAIAGNSIFAFSLPRD